MRGEKKVKRRRDVEGVEEGEGVIGGETELYN